MARESSARKMKTCANHCAHLRATVKSRQREGAVLPTPEAAPHTYGHTRPTACPTKNTGVTQTPYPRSRRAGHATTTPPTGVRDPPIGGGHGPLRPLGLTPVGPPPRQRRGLPRHRHRTPAEPRCDAGRRPPQGIDLLRDDRAILRR